MRLTNSKGPWVPASRASGSKASTSAGLRSAEAFLGIGATCLVALYVLTKSVQDFKPTPMFWIAVSALGACFLFGVYITVAVFADWPLPEPGPRTRRVWRVGALVVIASAILLFLWYLRGVFPNTDVLVFVAGVFVLATLFVLASPGGRVEPAAQPPLRPPTANELEPVLQTQREQIENLSNERARLELEVAACAEQKDAARQQRQAAVEQADTAQQQRRAAQEQLDAAREALGIQAQTAKRLHEELRDVAGDFFRLCAICEPPECSHGVAEVERPVRVLVRSC